MIMMSGFALYFFFSSRRRHTRCALVTGVQTCALPICACRRPEAARGAVVLQENCRLRLGLQGAPVPERRPQSKRWHHVCARQLDPGPDIHPAPFAPRELETVRRWERMRRSEEHTSELQSLMRKSYAVFCLTKKKRRTNE